MTWYAGRHIPQKERLAVRAVLASGANVFWPHYMAQVRHGTRRGYALRSWFKPYFFVEDGPSFSPYAVNTAMGVSTLVYIGERLLTVPDDLIWELKSFADPAGCIPAYLHKHRPPNFQEVKGPNIIAALEELRDLRRRVWASGMAATDRSLTLQRKIAC